MSTTGFVEIRREQLWPSNVEDVALNAPEPPVPRLAMMARVPELGRVKSRLARHVGQPQALRAHVQLLQVNIDAVAKALGVLSTSRFELHYAGDAKRPFFDRLARQSGAALIPQVAGDIGARMLAAAHAAEGACLIIGSDCGAMSADYLRRAAQVLNEQDAVIGSAEDGGYVLIGMRKPEPELFQGISWGTDRVANETRERARAAGIRLGELGLQWDVDTVQDWRRFKTLARPS